MQPRRQFAVNTIATSLNLVIQFGINFFLTSYLVRTVGSTTFGFWGLANSVVNYALIITTALNSMAARYIGIDYHRGNMRQASGYFSSVFVADLLFALIILLPSCIAIYYIDRLVSVPPDIVTEVKTLFYIVFFNMCCNVIFAVFGCVFIIKNRLDLSSVITIISNVIKAVILILLYWLFRPSIIYLGTATLFASIILAVTGVVFTKRLTPELKLSYSYSSFQSVKTIVASGVWNSLNQLSIVLLQGLDLLIANLFVSAAAMGLISVAALIPGVISTCIFTLANVFTPRFLELYSLNKFDDLFIELKNSIKFLTLISCIPIGFLVAFGFPFFQLWTPTTDVRTVYYLSILVLLPLFSGGAISSTNYLYTVADKVKWQAMALILTGVMNVTIVFILLKTTNLGIYAIVGVSAVMGFIRNIFFNGPLGAYCVHRKYTALWPEMFKSYISLIICIGVGMIVNHYIDLSTWPRLILVGGVTALVSTYMISLLLLTSSQRKQLRAGVKAMLIKR